MVFGKTPSYRARHAGASGLIKRPDSVRAAVASEVRIGATDLRGVGLLVVREPRQERQRGVDRPDVDILLRKGDLDVGLGEASLNHLVQLGDRPQPHIQVRQAGLSPRGRRLVDGEKSVRIHGRDIPANCHIELIESMSAHADSNEILRWLGGFLRPPKTAFLVHGEPPAMDALAARIHTLPGWATKMPQHLESVTLG